MIRETIAEFQEKLRQHYIDQNTAKMNIAQQEKKAEEIRSGYDQINRDQAEIKRQVQEIRLDHDRIAQEHPELAQRFKERRHRLDEHLKERRPDVYELVISLRDNKKKEE